MKFLFLIAFLVLLPQLVWAEDPAANGSALGRFDLRWEVEGDDLLLSIDTDLPDKDRLSI